MDNDDDDRRGEMIRCDSIGGDDSRGDDGR